jgi:membrane protease YdiL (CAAX protease family)
MTMDDAPPPSEPAPIPVARPVSAPSAWPRLLTQIAVVFGVTLVWQVFYALEGRFIVGRRFPGAELYGHVIGLGLLTFVAVALVLRNDPAPLRAVGLSPPLTGRDIGLGLLCIIPCYLANLVVAFAYVLGSGFEIEEVAVDKLENLDVLGEISMRAVVPISIFIGIYEEVLFRGFLLSRLRTLFSRSGGGWSAFLAVVVSSVGFGLGHAYQGLLGVMQTTVVGLVLGIVALRRRNIWACIVAHIGIDIFGMFLLKILGPAIRELLQATSQPA